MERRKNVNRISGMQQEPEVDPAIIQMQSNICALQMQIDELMKRKTPEQEDSPQITMPPAKEKKEEVKKQGKEKIRHVKNLPPVPLTDYDEVIWDPPSLDGTGDGQKWCASGRDTSTGGNYWYPNYSFTTLMGIPEE